VSFNLVDVSAAMYALVLNRATVTDTVAGVSMGGNLNIPLYQGLSVATFALMLRNSESPNAVAATDSFKTQYDIPLAYQNASPEVVHKKGEPAMLECEFRVLWDATLGFGKYRAQDAAPS
jgi:hypothetical protein